MDGWMNSDEELGPDFLILIPKFLLVQQTH